ncbi:hypothetical protein PAXRUDRAFT_147465 [Paxillus rubicundulus Ve08.2h10]|uniref:Uncharacterized protein n=1 Tax=Paxillus rubicundulus Ve08.2h10 TaxID=930991 RepID=A0A0D0E4V6_9AGAM|nr:hypothetical protein PAXRUDRAFT_147465 [Paxillus rubicundulus Ve08.2h10]
MTLHTSMLPEDAQERKLATITSVKQGTLDDHVREVAPMEHVIPYSDKLLHEAVVEWLISTNQPIQAVDHPSFKKMIDVASHATKGVIIPNQNATHHEIIDLFKKQKMHLKEHLNVGFLELVVAWN